VSSPYGASARVYDALFREKDYRGAVLRLRRILRQVHPNARRLLDVGCGTARHLEHLQRVFDVAGLDGSSSMLAVARTRCPGLRLHLGDLVRFDLGETFDVVTCLLGSLGYARTLPRLERAAQSLARHLAPGGVLVVEPWVSPERFVSGRLVFDRADEPDLKVARIYRTARRGTVSVFDSHYLVAGPSGIEHFTERQELGLFTARQYRAAFRAAGLRVLPITGDLFGYGLIVARKPAATPARSARGRRSA
jgi:SAM-dependent methyltransferase